MIKTTLVGSSLIVSTMFFVSCGGGGGGGTSTFTVGGTLTGLAQNKTLTLQNNGGDDLTLTSNGSFTFSTPIASGSTYDVSVKTNPMGQSCFVTNGSGTVQGSNVTSVLVDCYNSGILDPSFDFDGLVAYNSGSGEKGYAMVLDSSGRILVAGGINDSNDMAVWRFNPDGSPDTTFGSNGLFIYDSGFAERGESIALDASGRIIVAGYRHNGADYDMALWRLNPDGTLDTSFNNSGLVIHHNAAGGNWHDYGRAVAVDASGSIFVAGDSMNANVPGNRDIVVWKYKSDGTLDNSFSGDGIAVYNGQADETDYGYAITVDASGKVFVAGRSNNGVDFDMIVLKYNPDGSFDTNFDNDGVVVYSGIGQDRGSSVMVDSTGKVIVAGITDGYATLWRYNPNGSPDTSFDADGMLAFNTVSTLYAVKMDKLGRIIATGDYYNGNNYDMVVWRFNPDGSLDTGFNGSGMVTHDGGFWDTGMAIAIDSSGKIVIGGYRYNGNDYDMVVWRYIP